jgi:transcriptional regulator with XRE-family HTH domain
MVEAIEKPEVKQYLQQDYTARFREGRKASGVRLLDLAATLGISQQAILQFETGKQRLDLERFVAACDALKLNVRWVLKGLGEMWEGPAPVSKKARPAKRVSSHS